MKSESLWKGSQTNKHCSLVLSRSEGLRTPRQFFSVSCHSPLASMHAPRVYMAQPLVRLQVNTLVLLGRMSVLVPLASPPPTDLLRALLSRDPSCAYLHSSTLKGFLPHLLGCVDLKTDSTHLQSHLPPHWLGIIRGHLWDSSSPSSWFY